MHSKILACIPIVLNLIPWVDLARIFAYCNICPRIGSRTLSNLKPMYQLCTRTFWPLLDYSRRRQLFWFLRLTMGYDCMRKNLTAASAIVQDRHMRRWGSLVHFVSLSMVSWSHLPVPLSFSLLPPHLETSSMVFCTVCANTPCLQRAVCASSNVRISILLVSSRKKWRTG